MKIRIARAWLALKVYFGFAADPDAPEGDDPLWRAR